MAHDGPSVKVSDAVAVALIASETRIDELEAVIARLREWASTHGAALCPPGADTYGEGMRDAKTQVCRLLEEL